MEYFDIINEKDELISKSKRSEAHNKHLLHRAIIILLINDNNQVLLQLRKSTKKQYPLYWAGSVNGHVSLGESPQEAAYREMKEEIGIKTELRFIDKFIINDEVEYEMVHLYTGSYKGDFNLDKKESEKIEWFDLNTIKQKLNNIKLTPHCKKALLLL